MADIEETRAVIEREEVYDGKIIPSQQTAVDRPVRVREGAKVLGSIYGTSISTDREVIVEGSVLAAESVELSESEINGEVGTPGKIVCEESRIEGTVTGKKVILKECVVYGNVVGTDVILDNCVVLGVISADRDLTIEDSLCYTFQSLNDVTIDGAFTILPQAIVSDSVELESPIQVVGLGELDVSDSNGFPNMSKDDIYVENDSKYLTLAPRILNLSKVEGRIDELEMGVMGIVNDTSDDEASTSVSDLLKRLDINVDEIGKDIGVI